MAGTADTLRSVAEPQQRRHARHKTRYQILAGACVYGALGRQRASWLQRRQWEEARRYGPTEHSIGNNHE